MLANHAQRSLETAAAKTLKRIRRDRGRVVRRLQPLLTHIEENLFDPSLDVNQLKRSCGVRDNSVPIQFHAQLGLPPHAYIEECRLRTGCRLLRDTDLKIWQIADLLGYSSIQVFSRAFSRWASMRPTGFRRQARREGIAIPSRILTAASPGEQAAGARENGAPAARVSAKSHVVQAKQHPQEGTRLNGRTESDSGKNPSRETNGRAVEDSNGAPNGKAVAAPAGKKIGARIEVEDLRRALDGELEATAADQLIRRLLNLYPDQNPAPSPARRTPAARPSLRRDCGAPAVKPTLEAIAAGSVGGLLDTDQIESLRAEELWNRIREAPYESQVTAVRNDCRFRTPALFHHLCTRSLVDGRDNRKRGVRVAELALEALETVRFYVSSEQAYSVLLGKGYAWLGNARRLAMDFFGAENAFALAEQCLPKDRSQEPKVWVELLQNEAALRWIQRRPAEALPLCNKAVALLGTNAAAHERARLLLLRGNIQRGLFSEVDAASDYYEAISLLEGGDERYLLATAYQTLLALFIRTDRVDESVSFMTQARSLAKELSSKSFISHLDWYEGLTLAASGAASNAERKIRSARSGFLETDDLNGTALVSLDLAILYSGQGKDQQVIEVISQALPLFEAMEAHGEEMVSLAVLQKATATQLMSTAVLQGLRAEVSRAS